MKIYKVKFNNIQNYSIDIVGKPIKYKNKIIGKIVDVNDDFCYGIIYDKLLSNKIENKKIKCSFEIRNN